MEIPEYDFTLVPLKTVDIMDVPGLNKWIRKTIENILSKTVLNPNSIVIDVDKISQSKGNNIGVVCVQILSLENDVEDKLQIELDVDGRSEYQTSFRSGKNIAFNEYFYFIIQNVDEKINLSFYGDPNSSHRSQGSLFLKNVHLEPFEKMLKLILKWIKKL
ncbi:ca2+-dependent lipid-binding protein [Vairimorpha apis BRL 01]|uniref:Ca2+-dependent lipid-binding protein n=1 Tax=Vairimorpha apis BRL 01 TaxID=1037528 RepID=T0L3X6_9MICR|nr:ca2+-dependent lipid-binding protein [Vairimorpha apis BRL 01]